MLKDKLDYLRQLFGQVGKTALASREFKRYLREQAHWLQPYAAFCRLRDLHGTADFTQWGEHAAYPRQGGSRPGSKPARRSTTRSCSTAGCSSTSTGS